jgi:hypothetical protein
MQIPEFRYGGLCEQDHRGPDGYRLASTAAKAFVHCCVQSCRGAGGAAVSDVGAANFSACGAHYASDSRSGQQTNAKAAQRCVRCGKINGQKAVCERAYGLYCWIQLTRPCEVSAPPRSIDGGCRAVVMCRERNHRQSHFSICLERQPHTKAAALSYSHSTKKNHEAERDPLPGRAAERCGRWKPQRRCATKHAGRHDPHHGGSNDAAAVDADAHHRGSNGGANSLANEDDWKIGDPNTSAVDCHGRDPFANYLIYGVVHRGLCGGRCNVLHPRPSLQRSGGRACRSDVPR